MFDLIPMTRAMINPFYEMDRMSRSLFDGPARVFRTDIRETETGFALEAELPGCRKEDISIEVNGDRLTIQAQRKSENEQKDDQGNYLRRERFSGTFSRSFDVTGIDLDAITARYADGILTLTLPKKETEVPASRRLEIQ